MKKLIAILVSAVLLVTSIFSVSMFTVSADGIESTAVVPTIDDAGGLETVDNTANIPFDKLLKITANGDNTVNFSDFVTGDGIAFYIENNTGAEFFPGTYYLNSADGGKYAAYSTSADWYMLGEDDTEWEAIPVEPTKGYSAPVPNGFKGYVYLPISTSKILTKSGTLGIIAKDSVTWASMGYGRWAGYACAVSGGQALVSAPFAVNGISGGLPSVKGVTVGGTYYDWFAPVEEEEPVLLEDNVVMPTFLDEYGNVTNVYHTNENIPSSVIYAKSVSAIKNTAGLPFTSLLKFPVADEKNHTYLSVKPAAGKGAMVYVEMPKSADGNDVRFSTQILIHDGQSGEDSSRYQYGYKDWYFLAEGDSAWTAKTISYYGIPLPSGFKGYIYIPFNTITGGASDDPSTPENEARPQERNSETGAYIYKDNLTGDKTESATDAEGNPNAPVYTDQPSSANPYYANTGIDEQDTFRGLSIQTSANYMANNGNMALTDEIVVSAPVVVKGDVTDGTLPETRKIIAGGKEEYFFKSYVPYTGDAAHSVFRTPAGGRFDETYGDLVMTKIPAITPLVGTAYEFTNLSTQTRTFQSNTRAKDTELSIGVVFYVETTLENFEVNINSMVYKTDGTTTYPATSYNYGDLYYLKEGDTKWTATGSKDGSGASATYRRKLKTTGTFKGYIYQPFGGSASTQTAATPAYYSYAGITLWPTTADGSWTDAKGETATLKISQPMAVYSLDVSTNKVVLDGGALVDPITGEGVKGTFLDADTFVGNAKDLNILGDVMSLKPMTDPTRNENHVLSATGTFIPYTDNGYSGEIVANDTIFGDDLLRITGSETATQSAVDMVQMNYTKTLFADVDGYAIYMKNNSETPLRFAVQPYTVKIGGGTNYTQVNASNLPFLSYNDGKWEWTTKARLTSYTYELAAGESGFLYLSNANIYNGEYTNYLKIRTSSSVDYPTTDVDFTMSVPYAVNNFTQNAPGMAYVNGATVPQNLISGEFTIPNDYDGNLAVNLVDLVQSKDEAAATNFDAFRKAYLKDYFNDAEYSVLSAAFSVAPLKYNAADETTILSENPDRGYRSELFCQFAEKPLTIAETPNYNVMVSGTSYPVTVSANTIRGTKGVIDPANLDTDYNINHRDMTPYGVGSGGAIHTVPVAAAVAYAKANSLAYATEANLISAAVSMVSNYMHEDYRPYDYQNPTEEAGITNIDVAELKRPVYDYEDGYAEMEGVANGSNYGYYKWAKTHSYDGDGNLTEIKLLVNHGRRTIFATDTEDEWEKRWNHMFNQIYAIGANAKCTFTDKFGVVTYNNPISNNLFNAYLQFTDYAHKDELSDGILEALDYFFDFCREKNVKSCFRPAYNANYTQNAYLSQSVERYVQFRNNVASQCADEETMIAHIKQMAPVIAENKDVIHKISSGWIGFGGEMAAAFQYPPVSYKNVITALLDYHCIPNGLYFSSRSSTYYTNVINGVEAVAGYNSGNLDLKNGLTADAEWAEKYAKWCGFNNDAFFGDQNFDGWGSSDYYDPSNPNYDEDNAIAHVGPNDGELYTNGSHVYNITVDSNGVYHWIGDGTTATDNKIPTPIEAIRELAHHRYTDFSQWHGYLEKVNAKNTVTVMELWQDHDAEWVFEGDVDSIENGGFFNAEERAAEITAPITKELLEANGILYDPTWFNGNDTRNAYEFIRDHLGYRFVAHKVNVEYDSRFSDKVSVSVNLRNYGFASAFNMESTLAILDANGNVVQQTKTGDPSTWYSLAPDYYTVERTSSAQSSALTHKLSAEFDALTKSGTYYVAVKLENTAGTTARFANDVEVNEQGYNILGSFNFVNVNFKPAANETLKVMSYNIRCLRGGENADGLKDAMTEEQMNDTIAKFDSLLSREKPDLLIVTEDRTYFDTGCFETSGGEKSVWELMFSKHFDYAYHTAGGANWPHIYSNYELKDISRIDVAYTDTSDSRKPTVATITVDGTDITVIGCHPISGAEYADTNRVEYFEAIANYCENKDYVIIAGDMNTDSADPKSEYKPFVDAGMTLGNFGEFGEYVTYRFGDTANKIDNIIVKGLEMKNFWVGTEEYSDHLPIYSEIYLPKE